MTEEKDGPVHYQVSVTGRQAAAFFLGLLAALGLSFFFGMKTGAAAKRGLGPIAALTAQSDIQMSAAEPEGDRGDKTAPEPTEAPIGGFEAAAPESTRASAAKADPPATKVPKSAGPEEKSSPAEEPKIVELAPEPTAVPTRRAAATPVPAKGPASAAKGDDAYWVQIFVSSSARKADEYSKKLKADGFSPDVSLVPGKKDLFRVRIGPYSSRATAEAAATKVQKAEKLQTKPIVVPGK